MTLIEMLESFGLREAVMTLAIVLAVYVVSIFFRMRSIKRTEEWVHNANPHKVSPHNAIAQYRAIAEEPTGKKGSVRRPQEAAAPKPERDLQSERERARLLALEKELEQLRKEVGALRAEIMLVREAKSREPLVKPIPTQGISPQYNEAVRLAKAAEDPNSISEQCGISRAEAELVAALVKNRDH